MSMRLDQEGLRRLIGSAASQLKNVLDTIPKDRIV